MYTLIREYDVVYRVIWDEEGNRIKSRIFRTFEKAYSHAEKRDLPFNVQSLAYFKEKYKQIMEVD